MVLETMILSSVVASLNAVYQAYNKIKSNKERCKQLVVRCQLIVDRLQTILLSSEDAAVLRRINDLERTFQSTADTITKVGQQGYIASLLRSEENAALIEDSQRALTGLVSILALEQIIDVSAWQRENEVALRRDHRDLLISGKKIEQGNAAILGEVSRYGATLAELTQILQSMAANLGEPSSPNPLLNTPVLASQSDLPRPRSASSPTSTRPSISSILQGRSNDVSPTNLSATGSSRNRMTWTNRLRISPLSGVSRLAPRSAVEAGYNSQQQASLFYPTVVQSQETNDTDAGRSTLPDTPPPAFRDTPPALHDTSSPPLHDTPPSTLPETPPPAYRTWEEELAAAAENNREDIHSVNSASTSASTEAVRASNSPVPSPGSYFDKPLPDDPVLKVREALKRKEVKNFSAMKSIGPFGNINTRVLVEMWMLPKIKTFDRAIPLDCFVPIQRDHLQLVKSRVSGIGETLHPMLNETAVQPEYKHVLLLCPREVKPTVIVIKKHQRQPQQSVKAYVLDTVEATTLVSVKESGKKTWLLIPYYPEMYVWEAKQYIQKFFSDVIVVTCNLPGQASNLDDGSTMLESGVRSYEHNLSMKISSFV